MPTNGCCSGCRTIDVLRANRDRTSGGADSIQPVQSQRRPIVFRTIVLRAIVQPLVIVVAAIFGASIHELWALESIGHSQLALIQFRSTQYRCRAPILQSELCFGRSIDAVFAFGIAPLVFVGWPRRSAADRRRPGPDGLTAFEFGAFVRFHLRARCGSAFQWSPHGGDAHRENAAEHHTAVGGPDTAIKWRRGAPSCVDTVVHCAVRHGDRGPQREHSRFHVGVAGAFFATPQ